MYRKLKNGLANFFQCFANMPLTLIMQQHVNDPDPQDASVVPTGTEWGRQTKVGVLYGVCMCVCCSGAARSRGRSGSREGAGRDRGPAARGSGGGARLLLLIAAAFRTRGWEVAGSRILHSNPPRRRPPACPTYRSLSEQRVCGASNPSERFHGDAKHSLDRH